MKTSRGMIALLVWTVVVSLVVEAVVDHTYVTNESAKTIMATIDYPTGPSQFVDRVIPSFTHQDDENSHPDCTSSSSGITITVWVQGSSDKKSVSIDCDRSIVAYDSADLKHVDIFLVTLGHLFVKEGPYSLATIGCT